MAEYHVTVLDTDNDLMSIRKGAAILSRSDYNNSVREELLQVKLDRLNGRPGRDMYEALASMWKTIAKELLAMEEERLHG